MILSNLWMTLQKVEAAGHGDYIVNFAGDLCFMERKLAVIEENLFNTKVVGIKMGTKFSDTVSVFCNRIEAFVKLHPSAADLYVMTVNETKRNSIIYISVSEKKVSLTSFDDIDSDKYIESLIKNSQIPWHKKLFADGISVYEVLSTPKRYALEYSYYVSILDEIDSAEFLIGGNAARKQTFREAIKSL